MKVSAEANFVAGWMIGLLRGFTLFAKPHGDSVELAIKTGCFCGTQKTLLSYIVISLMSHAFNTFVQPFRFSLCDLARFPRATDIGSEYVCSH